MGGPSYEKPYPVKRSDGSQIIWDWNKREWVPYTEQSSPANDKKDGAPALPPSDAGAGAPDAPAAASAPDAPTGLSGASQDAGPSLHQKPRRRRLMIREPNPAMPGTSLLTTTTRFGGY